MNKINRVSNALEAILHVCTAAFRFNDIGFSDILKLMMKATVPVQIPLLLFLTLYADVKTAPLYS
jgi:hypothetical protein